MSPRLGGTRSRSSPAPRASSTKLEQFPSGEGYGTGAKNLTSFYQYFYHQDHLGSTGFVTDATGEVYQHLEYFPFGETWVDEVSDDTRVPYRFTGQEFDPETRLYYYGARYYDPRTSAWQNPDPALGISLTQPSHGMCDQLFKTIGTPISEAKAGGAATSQETLTASATRIKILSSSLIPMEDFSRLFTLRWR